MFLLAFILSLFVQSVVTEEGFKEVNGTKLFYRIVGVGEPIVMVHGGPGSNMLHLLPYCDTLASSFKLIYYDQRGCGKSSPLRDSQTASWRDHVEDLEALRRAFGLEKMNLLGHSWGGGLVMLYAITYPERVKRLIICNSMPAYEGTWKKEMDSIQRERELRYRVQEKLDALERSGLRDKNPELYFQRYVLIKSWRIFADTADASKTVYTIEPCPLVNHLAWESLKDYDFRDELKKLKIATLIIHGEKDIIPLKYADELHKLIPHSRFVITRKGHQPYIEDPKTFFGSIKEFLRLSPGVD